MSSCSSLSSGQKVLQVRHCAKEIWDMNTHFGHPIFLLPVKQEERCQKWCVFPCVSIKVSLDLSHVLQLVEVREQCILHPIPTEEPLAKLALINVHVALDKIAVKCLC